MTVSHANAFKAQPEFAPESKIKVGQDIWTEGTLGARLYAEVLSRNSTSTVGKVIDLAGKLSQPFTPKAVQGHLRWLYTAGQLEVDGKSYVVQAKPRGQPRKGTQTQPEQPPLTQLERALGGRVEPKGPGATTQVAELKVAKAKVEKPEAKPEQPKVEKKRKRVSTELLTAALRATAKKPETKAAASRQRSLVRTKKLAKAA
jgi:hypothetical protein